MSAQVISGAKSDESSSSTEGSEIQLVRPLPPPLTRSDAFDGSLENYSSQEENQGAESPVIVFRNSGDDISTGSRDSVVTLKHYDCLLGELRCPGCARPMHAPIFLCKSGHSVCELCTKTLSRCPLCHEDFTEIRSVTLEALAEKAYFLCKYSVHGCTVRLPFNLMRWHKQRCVYQVGDCFMGKVWGGCSWSGCEIDWIKHCMDYHGEKVFAAEEAQLVWTYPLNSKRMKSVLGFYIFQIFDETFNLYHVYDKPSAKSKWTMVCASKKDEKAFKSFAFQVELFLPEDPSRLLIQRHCCHGERDEDVLEEARCVCINLGDVMRFMSPDKILNYRVKVLDLRELAYSQSQSVVLRAPEDCSNCQPTKFIAAEDLSAIECTNHKRVPHENIIKRKSDVSKMIATISEEEFAVPSPEADRKAATVNTNGSIVVHSHNNGNGDAVIYSAINAKVKEVEEDPNPDWEHNNKSVRKNSKSSLLKEFNGYDSVKKIFQKTMSVDRSSANHVQKPPRKFLTLTNRKSSGNEFESDDTVSLKVRRSGSVGDAADTYSLPGKIPTTPPPKKTNKKASSFINLMRSNLKF